MDAKFNKLCSEYINAHYSKDKQRSEEIISNLEKIAISKSSFNSKKSKEYFKDINDPFFYSDKLY